MTTESCSPCPPTSEPGRSPEPSRREVLAEALCHLSAFAAAGLVPGCTAPPRSFAAGPGETVVVPFERYPELEAPGGVLRVVTPGHGPVYLRRTEEGALVAFSGVCTHQGCTVAPSRHGFRCPCHASTFDLEGRPQGGPAQAPLRRFEVKVEGRSAVLRLAPLIVLSLLVALGGGGCRRGGGRSAPPELAPGEKAGFPLLEHIDQRDITRGRLGFERLFEDGDLLFGAQFNDLDGAGALLLPDGTPLPQRFSRVPPGGGRVTGPNANACEGCHNSPLPTSAGEAASNVHQDPAGLGVGPFNPRNTISLFGSGVIQRLAEEITAELQALRADAGARALAGGPPIRVELRARGISFGALTVSRDVGGALSVDLTEVDGVDGDLVVRPFGWKGNIASLRDFTRSAARNELGLEAEELVARDPLGRSDPDGDGVSGELTVGDVTALTIYCAAQEVPQERERLVRAGLLPPPAPEVDRLARRGEELFSSVGCATCHIRELLLEDPVFEEPTARAGGAYLDPGIDPGSSNLDPGRPFRFHLVQSGDFPRLEPHAAGGARVRLHGDLKRHKMGALLADPQPTPVRGSDGEPLLLEGTPVEVPRDELLTPELWGVGSTGPWLHDGRAGTLEQAILLHGDELPPPPGDPDRSEAQESRDLFAALPERDRLAVVEYLRSLVLFSLPEEE